MIMIYAYEKPVIISSIVLDIIKLTVWNITAQYGKNSTTTMMILVQRTTTTPRNPFALVQLPFVLTFYNKKKIILIIARSHVDRTGNWNDYIIIR